MTCSQGVGSPAVRRVSVWLFLMLALFHIGISRGHFVGTDEINVYQTARSLYERGGLSVGHTRNTMPGRNGLEYSVYNAGLAVIALPLYAAGRQLHYALDAMGQGEWVRILSGPPSGLEPWYFGGDLEIVMVNFTNAFLTALLCVVFFRTSLLLGARLSTSLGVSIVLGTATYVAPFSIGLLRHTCEALFMVAAIYFLIADASAPSPSKRLWAGVMLGILLQVRLAAIICFPGILGYALYNAWVRTRATGTGRSRIETVARELVPIGVPLLVSLAIYFAVNWIKFDSVLGFYGDGIQSRFETPLLYGLHAFLFSPGASVFLFTPLLLLSPWTLRRFYRSWRNETVMILIVTASYLYFYSRFNEWHGLPTALGPRYLVAIIPLLMLPLALWLEAQGPRVRSVVIGLVCVGFAFQLVHVVVNFGYVYHEEGYPQFVPPLGFMFSLKDAPLLAHFRSMFDSPHLIDMWLVTMARDFGVGRMLLVLVPIASAASYCAVQLSRATRAAMNSKSPPPSDAASSAAASTI